MPATIERQFGIEFEFDYGDYDEDETGQLTKIYRLIRKVATRKVYSPGKYYTGLNFREDNNYIDHWHIGFDCGGMEVKTPPSTFDHWPEITAVLNILVGDGADTGENFGTHVHIARAGMSNEQNVNFMILWYVFEDILFDLVDWKRKKCGWCDPLHGNIAWAEIRNALLSPDTSPAIYNHLGRIAIYYSDYPTWECRVHHSTLDPSEIREWVMLLQVLAAQALKGISLDEVETLRRQDKAQRKINLTRIVVDNSSAEDGQFINTALARRWRYTFQPLIGA